MSCHASVTTRSTRVTVDFFSLVKSVDFIDAATSRFTYDTLTGLDHLQYPRPEAFGMSPFTARSLFYI
jgi:hypothetical protein